MDGMGDNGGVRTEMDGGGMGGGGVGHPVSHEYHGVEEKRKKQWGPPKSFDPAKNGKATYAKVIQGQGKY